MNPKDLVIGMRVFWADPGGGTCSRWGTVVSIGVDEGEPADDETIVALKMDDEGEVEALPHELHEDEPDNWNNDAIQFPRLLAEINAAGLTKAQYRTLSDSMDLTRDQIDELFDRAENEWLAIKERA